MALRSATVEGTSATRIALPVGRSALKVAEGTCLRISWSAMRLVLELGSVPMSTISRVGPMADVYGSSAIHGFSATRRGSSQMERVPSRMDATNSKVNTSVRPASVHSSPSRTRPQKVKARAIGTPMCGTTTSDSSKVAEMRGSSLATATNSSVPANKPAMAVVQSIAWYSGAASVYVMLFHLMLMLNQSSPPPRITLLAPARVYAGLPLHKMSFSRRRRTWSRMTPGSVEKPDSAARARTAGEV